MEKIIDQETQQLINRLKTAYSLKQQLKSRLEGVEKPKKQERIELAFYRALLKKVDKNEPRP